MVILMAFWHRTGNVETYILKFNKNKKKLLNYCDKYSVLNYNGWLEMLVVILGNVENNDI